MPRRKAKPSKLDRKFGPRRRLPFSLPALNLYPLAVAAVIFLAGFLSGGGLYLAFQPTLPAIPIIPNQLAVQTLSESLLFMIFLFVGVGGGYMVWSGFQSPVGRRPSTVKATVGIILLTLSFTSLYMLLIAKFPSL